MAASEEPLKWTPEMEVVLFKAMMYHKPIGLHKHWHMLCIHHRMITQGGVVIPTSEIWKHLKTLYDLTALDETETTSVDEEEFYLPSSFLYDDSSKPTGGTTTGEDQLSRKRQHVSSSPSPSASPISVTKRKRTQ